MTLNLKKYIANWASPLSFFFSFCLFPSFFSISDAAVIFWFSQSVILPFPLTNFPHFFVSIPLFIHFSSLSLLPIHLVREIPAPPFFTVASKSLSNHKIWVWFKVSHLHMIFPHFSSTIIYFSFFLLPQPHYISPINIWTIYLFSAFEPTYCRSIAQQFKLLN